MTTAAEVKHTPGPWTEDGFRTIVGADRTVVATVNRTGQVGHAHLTENANRRLIAAAPELLEACNAAAFMLANISHYVPDEEFEDEPNPNTVREMIDAAIAAATR